MTIVKYQIKYFSEFESDMAVIDEYLRQFHGKAVQKFHVLLKKKTAQLKQFPYSCPMYDDDPYYRQLVVGDYLVFYTVNDEDKIVEMHRVFHGSQDITRNI